MDLTREFTLELERRLKQQLPFIQVVTGARQVGKSTGVKQLLTRWKGPTHYCVADTSPPPKIEWITLQWNQAKALGKNSLIVIDEIQKIPDWSVIIKKLFDEDRSGKNLSVVILGSASLQLQRGLNESLAGRYEIIHVPHWNLSESKKAFGWNLENYLHYGGYPAPAPLISEPARWKSFMVESIIEPVIGRDIRDLVVIDKPALFRQTFELAMQFPAQEVSYNKLLGQLQDRGNVSTIRNYLELFEGAYLLRLLQKYHGENVLSSRSSSPKIIPLCPALINAFSHGKESDPSWNGRIFEAAIGAQLVRIEGAKVFYWREGNKFEVDFVFSFNGAVHAIEVKSGRLRNSRGLERFITLFPKAIPVVVDAEKGKDILSVDNPKDILSILAK